MHHSPHHKFMQSVLWSLKTRQYWSVNINCYKLVLWNLIFWLHLYSAQRLWLWLIKTNVKKIKFSHLHWLSGWNYPPSCVWFTWVGVLSQVRGPESVLITGSPYKVIIRALQLVLHYVLVSIGWHHCRAQNMIGPRNWSTVMWPAPIGWWHRVSPAIYTTRAQDLGSVCCFGSLWDSSSLRFGSTPPSAGSTVHHRQQPLLRESPPVERAHPLYIPYCVLPWSQPNPTRRSGAPGDTRYPSAMYKEPVMDL